MPIIIKTEELSKSFGDFIAVDALNMEIAEGEVCAFLGPNGAGKTTVIRMLCGLLEPSSGNARIFNYDLIKESEKIKRKIAYMSQKFSLYEDLTVIENLDFYAGLYSIRGTEKKQRMIQMLEMAELSARKHELVAVLSVGLRQRLALSCAMIARPKLLFLDEPTSGVSPGSRKNFFTLIQNLANEGSTVIVSTHFMDEAERCSKIVFLSNGKLIAYDTPENLKENSLDGYLVELKLDLAMERIDEIQSLAYVKECSIHGELLHVLIENSASLKYLEEYLGVKVNPIKAGLEDVFIALSKEKRGKT